MQLIVKSNGQNLWILGLRAFPEDDQQGTTSDQDQALARGREDTPVLMGMDNIDDDTSESGKTGGAGRSLLDEIVRGGARNMLAVALQCEPLTPPFATSPLPPLSNCVTRTASGRRASRFDDAGSFLRALSSVRMT